MKMRITVNGTAYDVDVEVLDGAPSAAPIAAAPAPAPVAAAAPAPAAAPPRPAAPAAAGSGEVASPIAGNVIEVKVKPGDTVAVNDTLLVIEAMKMESNVASPQAGTVKEVKVAAGDAVTSGQVLITF